MEKDSVHIIEKLVKYKKLNDDRNFKIMVDACLAFADVISDKDIPLVDGIYNDVFTTIRSSDLGVINNCVLENMLVLDRDDNKSYGVYSLLNRISVVGRSILNLKFELEVLRNSTRNLSTFLKGAKELILNSEVTTSKESLLKLYDRGEIGIDSFHLRSNIGHHNLLSSLVFLIL